jgi:hypothetical protein
MGKLYFSILISSFFSGFRNTNFPRNTRRNSSMEILAKKKNDVFEKGGEKTGGRLSE